MTLEMTRVEIVALKNDLHALIQALHRFGQVQIEPLPEVPEISAGPLRVDDQTVKSQEAHRLLLSRIEGLLEALGCQAEPAPARPVQNVFREAQEGLEKLAPQVEILIEQRENMQAEMASLPRYEATLRRLVPLLPQETRLADNATVGVLVNRAHAGVFTLLEDQVQELTGGRAALVSGPLDADTHALLIAFPQAYTAEIETLLGKKDVTRLRLPDEFERGSPDSMLVNLRSRLAALPDEIRALESELSRLGTDWCACLSAWRDGLLDSLAVFEVLAHLGETEHTFVLAGWLPSRSYESLARLLENEIGSQVLLRRLPLTEAARLRAPVVPQNPAPTRPFERLVQMFAYPTYGGMDPTRLMAIFLPLFFGMMLGDVGYGALLLGLCLLMLRKFRDGFGRDFAWVLLIGAGWTIVFGFLFGEVFGTLGEQLGLHPIWMHRGGEEMTSLFILALAVGVGHIVLGLLLGVWEAFQSRSRNHLLERGGMLLGIIGLLTLVAVLAGFLPRGWMTPASAGILVGIALLGAPMKWLGLLVGPIEFLGLIGNILSYLRIAAIGLASVYLAQVANEFAGVMGSLIVGVIIAVLIHALNLALGVFSPTIHSLRLHYVEFFRKFYEGGGRPYEPFRSRFERSTVWTSELV